MTLNSKIKRESVEGIQSYDSLKPENTFIIISPVRTILTDTTREADRILKDNL